MSFAKIIQLDDRIADLEKQNVILVSELNYLRHTMTVVQDNYRKLRDQVSEDRKKPEGYSFHHDLEELKKEMSVMRQNHQGFANKFRSYVEEHTEDHHDLDVLVYSTHDRLFPKSSEFWDELDDVFGREVPKI